MHAILLNLEGISFTSCYSSTYIFILKNAAIFGLVHEFFHAKNLVVKMSGTNNKGISASVPKEIKRTNQV